MRCILLLLFVALFQTMAAQNGRKEISANAWMEFGTLGFSPVKNDRSSGVDVALKCQVNQILANVQYHDYFDSNESEWGFDLLTKNNHYHAVNILLGFTNRKCHFGHVSFSGGPGLFWGSIVNSGIENKFANMGWVMEAAASVNIFPFAGINIKVFSNLNSSHSFIGLGADIQVGKMRDL